MRLVTGSLLVLLGIGSVVGPAGPARAALLAFDGRLVAVLPGLGEEEVASGVGVAEVDGLRLGEVGVLAASVSGTASLPVTDPGAAPLTSVRVRGALRTGVLAVDPSAPPFGEPAISGPFPLPGEVQLCLLVAPLPPCVGGVSFPLTGSSGAAGVGVGGLLTIGGTGALRVSLHGAPFTLNTAWVAGATSEGAAFTLSSSGSIAGPSGFTSTAGQPGGRLSAVVPLKVRSQGGALPVGLVPGFLRFELVFVPEPARGWMLASGALSLLALRRRRSRRVLAAVSALGLATGCFPELPVGRPGPSDHQRIAAVPLPGAVFNAAALNTRIVHPGFSIDTKVGPGKGFAVGWNSATRAWRGSWEMTFDGVTFVDARGGVHDVTSVPSGSAIPGTVWVVLDASTVKTKGGLVFAFDASGRLAAEHWSAAPFPRLAYAWPATSRLEVTECVSLAQQQAGACRLLASVVYGPAGPSEIVDEVSEAAGTPRRAHYAYDPSGRLVDAKTPRQHAQGLSGTRFAYDAADRIRAQTLPDGERLEYVYAQTHLVEARRVDPTGPDPTHRLDYASLPDGGFSVLHTNPVGGRTRLDVTAERELVRVERLDTAPPEVMTIDWHAGLRRPARIVSFANEVTELPDWQDDDPIRVVLPSGNTLAIAYAPHAVSFADPRVRPVASLGDDLGPIASRVHDPASGLPIQHANGEGETTTFVHQGTNTVSTTSPWGDTTDFTSFGAAGHWRTATSTAVPEVAIQRRFDRVGNPVVAAAGLQRGGVLERAYDRDRRLASLGVGATDAEGRVVATGAVTIERRADGRPTAIRRPLGADHELAYDALGRLVGVCERVLGACNDTGLAYDAAGRRTALTRANGMREEVDFDPYGRVVAQRALRHGVLEGEASFVWEHDRIVEASDSLRGETRHFTYDAAGRVASVEHSTHGEIRLVDYDLRSRPVRETLVAPPGPGGGPAATLVLGVDYDLADRPTRRFVDDGSPAGVLLRERVIEDGRIVRVRDGSGNERESLFDAQTNRLAGFRMVASGGVVVEDTTLVRSIELAPTRFQVRSETTTALAGTVEEYWLNRPGSLLEPDGRIGMRVFRSRGWDDGVLVHDRSFAWDALSNAMEAVPGDAFAYNADRTRLLSASVGGGDHAYAYDAAGFVVDRDGLEIAWTATGRVARVGPEALPLAEARWDLAGGLVSVHADGETRTFGWFGGRVETDPVTGGPGWVHLDGVSLPFAGPERRYRHVDFRGNTLLVSDETGTIVSHRRHHAFGLDRVHGSGGSGGGSALGQLVLSGFAGGVAVGDPAVGLHGARVLDYDTGRFLSPDPILHPLNQVTYAVGNPILFEDRGGLHEVSAQDVTIARAGVAIALTAAVGSAVGFVGAVALFNAAPTALVAASGLVVVGAGLVAISAFAALGLSVAIVLATHEAVEGQEAGQQKHLELDGDLRSVRNLSRVLPERWMAAGRSRRLIPAGLGAPVVAPGAAIPCASLIAPPLAWDEGVLWLRAVALVICIGLLAIDRAVRNLEGHDV